MASFNFLKASKNPRIYHAQKVIQKTYGDFVSPFNKGKNLNKFGRNLEVGSSYETVSEFQGTTANETLVSTNLIDSVVSSNAADTMTVTIEGQTIDGSGNFTFSNQQATLNGQTPVALTTDLARATRIYVSPSGTFDAPQSAPVGTVSVYDNTDGQTAGVPDTDAATKLILSPGLTQSEKCATTISQNDYWLINTFSAGIGNAGGSAARVTVRVETMDVANGGVWRPVGRDIIVIPGQLGPTIDFEPLLIVPPNHDIRVRAKTNSNTAEVYAELRGILAN